MRAKPDAVVLDPPGDLSDPGNAAGQDDIRLIHIQRAEGVHFFEIVPAAVHLATGNTNFCFLAQPGQAPEIIMRQRFFKPIDIQVFERFRHLVSVHVIPWLLRIPGHLPSLVGVHHDF